MERIGTAQTTENVVQTHSLHLSVAFRYMARDINGLNSPELAGASWHSFAVG